MQDASERDLVARLGTDPAAFEEFYRRHVDAVTLFAVRPVGLPDQTADLVAEVFLEVIEPSWRPRSTRPGRRGCCTRRSLGCQRASGSCWRW
jgi:DNA-directed RNA polymerase specialized sigma24 family protein